MKVKFITSAPALTYDSRNDRVVKIVSLIDTKGREWERYDGGKYVRIAQPTDPERRRPRKK